MLHKLGFLVFRLVTFQPSDFVIHDQSVVSIIFNQLSDFT